MTPWQQAGNAGRMFDDAEVQELSAYIAGLPTATDLSKMSEADKKALSDRRRWALVYYALSLAKDAGQPPVPTTAGFPAARTADLRVH